MINDKASQTMDAGIVAADVGSRGMHNFEVGRELIDIGSGNHIKCGGNPRKIADMESMDLGDSGHRNQHSNA